MTAVTTHSPTVTQMSGKDPTGRWVLSVLAKRTYTLQLNEACVLAAEQIPLTAAPEPDPEQPLLLLRDTDLYAFKPATDVVVKGHAYGYSGETQFEAGLQIGQSHKRMAIVGDRQCALSRAGTLLFSNPKPVAKVPLRYSHAYGGRDQVAERENRNPYEFFQHSYDPAACDLSQASPYRYPRNPCGRGYLITPTPQAVEQLALPNLEDPLDPLTPQRLPVGDPLRWPTMPLPQATDWMDYGFFPRIAFLGAVPLGDPGSDPLPEVARGFVPAHILQERLPSTDDAFRATCGASLGLQVPYLRGGEPVRLDHIHPRAPLVAFFLPADRPHLWTDGRKGKLNQTDPVIHTLLIEPDESRLSIVWRGTAPALRPYMPEELEKMPFRVDWSPQNSQ